MTVTAFRPLAMPALMMLSLGSFTGCDTRECSNQGACGEDAWCSPDGVCLPLDEVMTDERDAPDAPAPAMGGGGGPAVSDGGGSLTLEGRAGLHAVTVELEGFIGWFEVGPANEQSLWVQDLLPGGTWRIEVWLRGQEHYVAALFIDVDEVLLDDGPQTVNALVTSCSTPDASGAFEYDRSFETEVTVTPADDTGIPADDTGGFIVELADTELLGALGPIAAAVRVERLDDAP